MSETRARNFLNRRRDDIVARWLTKIEPGERALTKEQRLDSMHLFLDEVVLALSGGGSLEAGRSDLAREHGSQRQQLHLSLPMVMLEYGALFESVVESAEDEGEKLPIEDLLVLSRALYQGAAESADEFIRRHAQELRRRDYERFAFIAHELRNPLASAKVGWELIVRTGSPAPARAAAAVTRNLDQLTDLVDRSLLEARLEHIDSDKPLAVTRIDILELLSHVQLEASTDADAKNVAIEISCQPLAVMGDPKLLRSAISNLVRNAVKFSRAGGLVALRGHQEEGRVLIEVEDECGGIPPEKAETIFQVFSQAGRDRSGFGLGLAIAKQAVVAHGGTISIRNVAAKGCVFVIDLAPA